MTTNNVATKSDIKRLEKNIKGFGNRILESEVKILGELKDMREDNAAHQFSHKRINDDLQEHDKRLVKLETAKA